MNSMKYTIIMLLIIVSAQVSVRSQTALAAKDTEAIRSIQESYRTAWLKNDEASILSFFWNDATFYPNGGSPVRGMEQIRKFWFAPSDTVTTINTFDATTEDITGDRNYAAMTGTNTIHWTSSKKDKSETKRYLTKSSFISIFVRRGGEWKIFKQFWNAKTEEIK